VSATIVIGADDRSGAAVHIDVEELLATRLLVQGNSGSGKSHLLRRILEQSASVVQQVVIDPEGRFRQPGRTVWPCRGRWIGL
jgi:DNA helicase HerA-like ATPase